MHSIVDLSINLSNVNTIGNRAVDPGYCFSSHKSAASQRGSKTRRGLRRRKGSQDGRKPRRKTISRVNCEHVAGHPNQHLLNINSQTGLSVNCSQLDDDPPAPDNAAKPHPEKAMTATRQVYYQDAYQKELDATVLGVDGDRVLLDQTIFYPEGGGQPGDTGDLTCPAANQSLAITDTRKGEAGAIWHQLETADHGLKAGDAVRVTLDWDRRYRHMRMHTGMHLLGSLIPVPVTGGSVGADKSRLDFDLGDHLVDKDDLTERMNALIEADHAVTFETITDAELDAKPELVRTMSVQPPRGSGVIRMVRISDVDFQPCGGTHLNRVGEIGRVRISKIENKGKRNRRMHLVFED